MSITNKKFITIVLSLILFLSISIFSQNLDNRYYLGSTVNTGKDTGYSKSDFIEEGDLHWGWKIGDFYIDGFSQVIEGDIPVFLKTVGDDVTLHFDLQQNILKLNDDTSLTVCEDTDGYDQYFQIEKTNFGRGVLLTRHTDYQNYQHEPTIYTDFLSARMSNKADTTVLLLEEGDYEIALNYEVKNTPVKLLGISVFPSYENYRIFFKFSVRNGNCMVFPFDVKTKSELTNSTHTENGFYLDMARSKYLDINIKKEILTDGVDGLVEDIRFNKPAKDGEEFTDEGIYTITATNQYTGQQTIKKIYVGNNKVLKAHVATGLPISEINKQISLGAEVSDTGSMVYPVSETVPVSEAEKGNENGIDFGIVIIILIVIVVVSVVVILVVKKKKLSEITEKEGEKI